MGYDSRAVKVHKSIKAMATLLHDKPGAKFFIKETVKVLEKAVRTKTAHNRGEKVDD